MHRFNANSNLDGLLNETHRQIVETHLERTLRGMLISYGLFTAGFFILLFSGLLFLKAHITLGLMTMLVPALGLVIYSWIRDAQIRKLGFTRARPYPAEWSEDFNEAETELFKKFTIVWTLLFTVWAVILL